MYRHRGKELLKTRTLSPGQSLPHYQTCPLDTVWQAGVLCHKSTSPQAELILSYSPVG